MGGGMRRSSMASFLYVDDEPIIDDGLGDDWKPKIPLSFGQRVVKVRSFP